MSQIMHDYGVASNDREFKKICQILCQSLELSTKQWESYYELVGEENFRLVRQNGQVVSGLGISYTGQWFGERCLQTAVISLLGTAPECRGKGAAVKLLRETVKELYLKGYPLSTVNTHVYKLYKKAGYELAGTNSRFTIPAQHIGTEFSERSLPMISSGFDDWQKFQELYRQQAMENNGNLERSYSDWKKIFQVLDNEVYAYFIGFEGNPEGYVIFSQLPSLFSKYDVEVRDIVTLTPRSIQRLWTFFADQRDIIENIVWIGPTISPFSFLLENQSYKMISLNRWLLRIINVKKALENRGYSSAVRAELHLKIRDELIPNNSGNIILHVFNGKGHVVSGGRGDLELSIELLSSLFTGFLDPCQLQFKCCSSNTSINTLSLARMIFSGSEPWISNFS